MSLNDTSMHPTGVQGAYPGVQNPSTSSTLKASDAFAQEGDLSGHEEPKKAEPVPDVVEGAPGVIESAELAPLGEDKVAADPPTTLLDQASGVATSLVDQASGLAKQAYDAVVGEKPRVPPKPPRKSNTNTPIPGAESDPNQLTLAERLSVHELPKPFKNPYFVSRLSQRTATASSTQVKKNVKQILTLERERLSGGDGFLSAAQAAAKARGEPIDLSKKKKNPAGKQRGNIANLRRGNKPGPGTATGTATPATEITESGRTTPVDEDEDEDDTPVPPPEVPAQPADGTPRKEIITYHTPTAPPSLLPPKKYCDITGLHAAYTDPRTKLRYKGLEVWHVVRGLGPGGDQAYLALRNAQTSLK